MSSPDDPPLVNQGRDQVYLTVRFINVEVDEMLYQCVDVGVVHAYLLYAGGTRQTMYVRYILYAAARSYSRVRTAYIPLLTKAIHTVDKVSDAVKPCLVQASGNGRC